MEFLVVLTQDWTALRDRTDLDELIRAERLVGAELRTAGTLQQIWRLPGQRANVGVWQAVDATDLHRQLSRLPLWPWLTARVDVLAAHELTRPLDQVEAGAR
jgi:muconolactone D-isomerase